MISRSSRSKDRTQLLLVIGALLLLGALIYSGTFYSSFHFDDKSSILENFSIRNISNLRAIWDFWPTRFVTNMSFALNYHFGRLDVSGYHIFNFSVHLCAAIMVWWFMLLTFSTPAMNGKKITEHSHLIAFFGASIFIAHPVQTEAVTYIVQRAASLATFFYLASLCLYIKSRLLQVGGKSPIISKLSYAGSLAAAVTAMFTKEMAITLPLMIILYEYCFLKTDKKFGWKHADPFLAMLSLIPITMFLTKSIDFAEMRRVVEYAPRLSSWQYLFTQFNVMVTYLRLLFIPINQNFYYDYHITKSLLELPALVSLIILVSILTVAVKIFSKYRLISFGIFWFFLTLLPESSIVPIDAVIFEHRLYLPMVGFVLFLVSGIYYIFGKKALKAVVIALIIMTSCCAVLSYRRNLVWKDDITLWNDTVHKSPGSAISYNNRGVAYYGRGDFSQAMIDFNMAIRMSPGYTDAYNNRGSVYEKKGKLFQSILDYTRAIILSPGYSRAYYNRGVVYGKQCNFSQAILDFGKAIELRCDYADAYYGRGVIYYLTKQYDKAWADVRKAEDMGYTVNPEFLHALEKAR